MNRLTPIAADASSHSSRKHCSTPSAVSVVVLAALLSVAAGCGGGSAQSGSGSGSVGSAASSQTIAPPPVCPNTDGGSCLGILRAGTYSTKRFQPQLTYTVPAGGWTNYEDKPGSFTLVPPGVTLDQAHNATNIILVWRGVLAATMNCSGSPNRKVATSPRGLAAWFVHQSALDTSRPQPVTLGRLHGYALSVSLAPHGGVRCGGGPSRQAPLLDFAPETQAQFGIGSESDHALVYLLGFNSQGPVDSTIAVIADGTGPHPPSLAADAAIIRHFHFSPT